MNLSREEILQKQNEVRAKIALKLCIVMMVSDRVIASEELAKIYEIIKEDDLFQDAVPENSELINLISEIQQERSHTDLHTVTLKYSAIKNKETRVKILSFLDRVMLADGIVHEKEQEMLDLIRELWRH
jgi:uncharacterized tellurite resistance protein B-like protein